MSASLFPRYILNEPSCLALDQVFIFKRFQLYITWSPAIRVETPTINNSVFKRKFIDTAILHIARSVVDLQSQTVIYCQTPIGRIAEATTEAWNILSWIKQQQHENHIDADTVVDFLHWFLHLHCSRERFNVALFDNDVIAVLDTVVIDINTANIADKELSQHVIWRATWST